MDVLLTKDNILVVTHDNNLKYLANMPKKISGLTLNEVKSITIKGGGKEEKILS